MPDCSPYSIGAQLLLEVNPRSQTANLAIMVQLEERFPIENIAISLTELVIEFKKPSVPVLPKVSFREPKIVAANAYQSQVLFSDDNFNQERLSTVESEVAACKSETTANQLLHPSSRHCTGLGFYKSEL